jgi:hypothetical protein
MKVEDPPPTSPPAVARKLLLWLRSDPFPQSFGLHSNSFVSFSVLCVSCVSSTEWRGRVTEATRRRKTADHSGISERKWLKGKTVN